MDQSTAWSDSRNRSHMSTATKGLLIGAAALVAYGISRRSKGGAALATAGTLLGFKAAKRHPKSQSQAHAKFLVNATPEKAYQLWRDFANLPRFMRHLKSVRVLDDRHSEWTVLGPLDQEIKWNAEITEEVPNERISWTSTPDSPVQTSGSVLFWGERNGRGTMIDVRLNYAVGNRRLAEGLATLLGKHPQFAVREDVRRFKALLEAGEVPTIVGQTHGPRGVHGSMEQMMFRETGNLPDPQAATNYRKTA